MPQKNWCVSFMVRDVYGRHSEEKFFHRKTDAMRWIAREKVDVTHVSRAIWRRFAEGKHSFKIVWETVSLA